MEGIGMGRSRVRLTGVLRGLRREAPEGPPQRLAQPRADEEDVDDRAEDVLAGERVVELDRDPGAVVDRLEGHGLTADELLVEDVDDDPQRRVQRDRLLRHAAAAVRARLPDELRARLRPGLRLVDDPPEAV